jgi:hypothetical protein
MAERRSCARTTGAAGSTQRPGSTIVDPEAAIEAILADPEVDLFHSRNVSYGRAMFAVTRPN